MRAVEDPDLVADPAQEAQFQARHHSARQPVQVCLVSENLGPGGVVDLAGPDGMHPLRYKRADHEPVGRVELVDNGAAVNGAERQFVVLQGNRDNLLFLLQPGPQAITLPVQRLQQSGGVCRHTVGVPQNRLQHVSWQAQFVTVRSQPGTHITRLNASFAPLP